MILGDGKRRNIAKVHEDERKLLKKAFIALNTDEKFHFPGGRDDKPFAGAVSYWFKQDEIHQATHVHGGPAFLPWHRELCNRFERLLRKYDERISLHYWDFTTDPRASPDGEGHTTDLFIDDFMGNYQGEAGDSWRKAKFYNPDLTEHFRGTPSEDKINHPNPNDLPQHLIRMVQKDPPKIQDDQGNPITEADIINACTYSEMRQKLEAAHNYGHWYIGGNEGTMGNSHTSFRDPFVFLLHSNVDRLFAAWQRRRGYEWRLDPKYVYGSETNSEAMGTHPEISVGILTLLSPWAGVGDPRAEPGVKDVRPWASPDNWHKRQDQYPEDKIKDSRDPSIVIPPEYDDLPGNTPFNLCQSPFKESVE